jgi:hypothetical protein
VTLLQDETKLCDSTVHSTVEVKGHRKGDAWIRGKLKDKYLPCIKAGSMTLKAASMLKSRIGVQQTKNKIMISINIMVI